MDKLAPPVLEFWTRAADVNLENKGPATAMTLREQGSVLGIEETDNLEIGTDRGNCGTDPQGTSVEIWLRDERRTKNRFFNCALTDTCSGFLGEKIL